MALALCFSAAFDGEHPAHLPRPVEFVDLDGVVAGIDEGIQAMRSCALNGSPAPSDVEMAISKFSTLEKRAKTSPETPNYKFSGEHNVF